MKNRGFTLIELLTVIVIIGILSVIVIPIVQNIIHKSEKELVKTSAANYIKAVETYITDSDSDDEELKVVVGNNAVSSLKSLINVDGIEPSAGYVTLDQNYVITYARLYIKEYKVIYNGKDYTLSKSNKTGSTGPTKVAAQEGETHKGIVYLDPTDIDKTCNASNSVSTTETKTGCMKWYIYDDSGNTYKMILDHNAIARVRWNADYYKYVAYASSEAKAAMTATLTNWEVTPDLITTSEINAITGKTGFDSADTDSWYYLDTKTQTQGANASTKSKYAWLYDNLNNCTSYGCNVKDNNTTYELYGNSSSKSWVYGYWTRDTVGPASSVSFVWVVDYAGELSVTTPKDSVYGVRPVIEIAKVLIP